jgi:hypothetical protein
MLVNVKYAQSSQIRCIYVVGLRFKQRKNSNPPWLNSVSDWLQTIDRKFKTPYYYELTLCMVYYTSFKEPQP